MEKTRTMIPLRLFTTVLTQFIAALAAILLVSACSTTTSQSINGGLAFARVTAAGQYIEKVYKNKVDRDAEKLKTATETLSSALTIDGLVQSDIITLKYWRGVGLHLMVTAQKFDNGETPEQSSMELALADFDYVLSSEQSANYPQAAFIAGLVANNHLGSGALAKDYWLQCAANHHAGCLNIVAARYFSGESDFGVDLQKSIDTHTIVFDTGKDFTCAGSFSGRSLATLATYLPQYSYRETWKSYLTKALDLNSELVQDFGEPDICSHASAMIHSYILHLANGENKPTLLMQALVIVEDDHERTIANIFLQKSERSEYDMLPREKSDYSFCRNRLTLIRYSLLKNGIDDVAQDVSAILTADPLKCSLEQSWLREMGLTSGLNM